jgi:hypothetical protein
MNKNLGEVLVINGIGKNKKGIIIENIEIKGIKGFTININGWPINKKADDVLIINDDNRVNIETFIFCVSSRHCQVCKKYDKKSFDNDTLTSTCQECIQVNFATKPNFTPITFEKYENDKKGSVKSLDDLKKQLVNKKIWLNVDTMEFGSEAGYIGTIVEINFDKQYVNYIDYEHDEIEDTIDDFINLMNGVDNHEN